MYWRHQSLFDIFLAVLITFVVTNGELLGFPNLIELDNESIILSSRAWVAPILTLLGMTSATTAFIFSVIDRNEFEILKKSKSKNQLWNIFSENIFWLSIASVVCAISSFFDKYYFLHVCILIFIFNITCICILKFSWVMRQIISVRIANS